MSMKTYNYKYIDGPLEDVIDFSCFEDEQSVLIQVFCGQDRDTFENLIHSLLENLPQAICIGTTTDGEICEDVVSTFQTSISLSVLKEQL